MDEEERNKIKNKNKKDDGDARYFTRFGGTSLFVDLWEAQPCL